MAAGSSDPGRRLRALPSIVSTASSKATAVSPLDATELDALVAAHQAAVWRYLRFLGAEGADAEDLVQETFVAVWRRPFERRSDGATRRYLCVVARNLFLMARRSGSARLRWVRIEDADEAWVAHAEDGGDGYLAGLRACLALLPERTRRALELLYGEGASRESIGAALGLAVEGVKTMLRRTRAELRTCVERRLEA